MLSHVLDFPRDVSTFARLLEGRRGIQGWADRREPACQQLAACMRRLPVLPFLALARQVRGLQGGPRSCMPACVKCSVCDQRALLLVSCMPFAAQVSLAFMHSQGIVNADIKPDNILFCSPPGGHSQQPDVTCSSHMHAGLLSLRAHLLARPCRARAALLLLLLGAHKHAFAHGNAAASHEMRVRVVCAQAATVWRCA